MNVMSVVNVMRGLDLMTQSLNLINRCYQNTSLAVVSVMSVVTVMSVLSVMRGLYLITQSSTIVNRSNQNTS